MNTIKLNQPLAIAVLAIMLVQPVFARKLEYEKSTNAGTKSINASGCVTPSARSEMALNNIRALIFTGGDMWWDLQGNPKYEIPKGSGKTSLFCGAIWIGGTDVNGQLRVAAARYRTGQDYFTGPLISNQGTTSPEECLKYDKHFKITRNEVAEFRSWWNAKQEGNTELLNTQFKDYNGPPTDITNYPGNNTNPDYEHNLAPYHDENEDGIYNPDDGDYPYYDLDKSEVCGTSRDKRVPRLYGDETLWWVYNDRGNIHTESDGKEIGMEIRAQYFAFSTNDELNNMTFGNYALINRSTYTLQDCYFGVWTDGDLGFYKDDYCGTDVTRGLGYIYNADDDDGDGSGNTYGKLPPAVGVDFFEGPYMDAYIVNGDTVDRGTAWDTLTNPPTLDINSPYIHNGCINGLNFGDGVINNERWGMRRFMYHRNSGAFYGDPETAVEYYNYLIGKWRNGTWATYGGTGYDGTVPSNFMYPYNTDPSGWGTGIPQAPWPPTMPYNNGPQDDMRIIQSAGPFTLTPGMTNDITVGMVWARATSGGATASIPELQRADDKAQRLFDVCFRIVDGPNAPELDIIELDKELIFHISNVKGSNNYQNTPEDYKELDPFIVCPTSNPTCDNYFTFQGYQVFQLKDESSSVTDIENPDKARLVFQCDIKDTVSRIINFEFDNQLGVSVPKLKVEGKNTGIQHSFTLTEDAFSAGDKRLVNHKTYYYIAIAYGYNNYKAYNPEDPNSLDGQKKPYLPSRSGVSGAIATYAAIPHITSPANNGTILNSQFGDGPKITQIEGHGNGNNALRITQNTINKIMAGSPWKADSTEYENGYGPVKIKVIDPLKVPSKEFGLKFIPDSTDVGTSDPLMNYITASKWLAYTIPAFKKEDTIKSDSWISYLNEQIIPDWGISITIQQIPWPLKDAPSSFQNGYISSSVTWADPNKIWATFISDQDGCCFPNWIRAGISFDAINISCNDINGDGGIATDKDQYYEKIINGTWAPYALCMQDYPQCGEGVAFWLAHSSISTNTKRLSSIQVVITKDKTKWSRCPVIEMAEYSSSYTPGLSEGGQYKFGIRKHTSVDKNGSSANVGDSTNINSSNYISSQGMGWFPGFAIDLETGERLNIVFGEDSHYPGQNGADMLWNPTNNYASVLWFQTGGLEGDLYLGGKHVIYVFGHNGDTTTSSNAKYYMPAYDEGRWLHNMLTPLTSETGVQNNKRKIWQNAMWVTYPTLSQEVVMQTNPTDPYYFITSDVTFNISIANPYQQSVGDLAVDSANVKNDNLPLYNFSLKDLVPVKNDNLTAKDALDLIRVVPNPYYGYCSYEKSQLDYKAKITNLPQTCTISIYNISGTLIRRFKKDSPLPYQDWDLKNEYGITIASGVYIFHIDAPGIGEKIVKWFGALRPLDLNSF